MGGRHGACQREATARRVTQPGPPLSCRPRRFARSLSEWAPDRLARRRFAFPRRLWIEQRQGEPSLAIRPRCTRSRREAPRPRATPTRRPSRSPTDGCDGEGARADRGRSTGRAAHAPSHAAEHSRLSHDQLRGEWRRVRHPGSRHSVPSRRRKGPRRLRGTRCRRPRFHGPTPRRLDDQAPSSPRRSVAGHTALASRRTRRDVSRCPWRNNAVCVERGRDRSADTGEPPLASRG